jgi:hypothetical protein
MFENEKFCILEKLTDYSCMKILKTNELVAVTFWQLSNIDGKISVVNQNFFDSLRIFFKINNGDLAFIKSDIELDDTYFNQIRDSDPITKALCRFIVVKICSNDVTIINSKNKELIKKFNEKFKINNARELGVFDEVNTISKLFDEITDIALLVDDDLTELLEMEKEFGVFFDRSIRPFIKDFFESLERNNLFIEWETNYLSLTKSKSELTRDYGSLRIEDLSSRYKELKPIIKNYKKIKEKQEIEILIENKTTIHEFSVAHGVTYCRYCGGGDEYRKFDCHRNLGHKYRVRNVPDKWGRKTSNKPVCDYCGDVRYHGVPDYENKFECQHNPKR